MHNLIKILVKLWLRDQVPKYDSSILVVGVIKRLDMWVVFECLTEICIDNLFHGHGVILVKQSNNIT